MNRRTLVALSLLFGCFPFASSQAQTATDYPNKPVKLIVPFPAGGTSDIMGRMIAEELGKQLKQPFVVENKGGAGGAIGTDQAAKAPADGYTLLLSGIGSNAVIHGFATPKPGYDRVGLRPHLAAAGRPQRARRSPELPCEDLQGVRRLREGQPRQVQLWLQVHVLVGTLSRPNTSSRPRASTWSAFPTAAAPRRLNDVLANQIPVMFTNQDVVLPHVKAGKLRALAVTSAERNPLYPDVPTVAESGYPGFTAVSWTGLSAPKPRRRRSWTSSKLPW